MLLQWLLAVGLFLSAIVSLAGSTEPVHHERPRISLIIDDIGYRLQDDRRAISLSGPVTYAILPHTPYAVRMARLAKSLDKDVLVHMPMEALNSNHLLGPGALTLNMAQAEFIKTINDDIESVPHAIGISNHMGSLLTGDTEAMRWLMQTLKPTGLFYMDSMTSAMSVAGETAGNYQVPYLRRDLFLDHDVDPGLILEQCIRLIEIAREKGSAIGIGHPHPETIEVLQSFLPQLTEYGVQLVSIREILNYRSREVFSWQSSSSP